MASSRRHGQLVGQQKLLSHGFERTTSPSSVWSGARRWGRAQAIFNQTMALLGEPGLGQNVFKSVLLGTWKGSQKQEGLNRLTLGRDGVVLRQWARNELASLMKVPWGCTHEQAGTGLCPWSGDPSHGTAITRGFWVSVSAVDRSEEGVGSSVSAREQ